MAMVGGVVHSHESWPSRLRLMVGPSGVVKLCGTRGKVESLPKVSRLSCRAGHSGTRQGSCSIEPDRTEHGGIQQDYEAAAVVMDRFSI